MTAAGVERGLQSRAEPGRAHIGLAIGETTRPEDEQGRRDQEARAAPHRAERMLAAHALNIGDRRRREPIRGADADGHAFKVGFDARDQFVANLIVVTDLPAAHEAVVAQIETRWESPAAESATKPPPEPV